MTGQETGFVGRVRQFLTQEGLDADKVKFIHCLIHRENLCAQSVTLNSVMTVVVRIVNVIRSHALRHRQFQQFLEDINSDYSDVSYYCQVRWLSRGNMLNRFFHLRSEIKTFLETQNLQTPELSSEDWICDLAFLVDLTSYLNSLNLKLQGKDRLIINMIDDLKAFMDKLKLWINQVDKEEVHHFPCLQKILNDGCKHLLPKYKTLLEGLLNEFNNRFGEVQFMDHEWRLFSNPFKIHPHDVLHDLQLELIDLQNSTPLRNSGNLGLK